MICARTTDLIQGSCMCLESIRMYWGYKYLAPTPQGAPRRHRETLNGISGLHPLRQIGEMVSRVCITL